MDTIHPKDIEDHHILIDVRTPSEFQAEKIPNSQNIPLDELPSKVNSLENHESLVLVCAGGNRAKKAQEILRAHQQQATVLERGIRGWKEASLTLDKTDTGMISLERQVRIVAGALVATGSFLALTVHPYWAALSAFVGCGLVFAGVTDTCGMAMLLAKLPYNKKGCGKSCS